MALSKAEREHILRWSEDDGEPATFYTHNHRWVERMLRAGAKAKTVSMLGGKPVAWTVEFDPSWIRLPTGRKRKGKPLSDAHKAALKAGRAKSIAGEKNP